MPIVTHSAALLRFRNLSWRRVGVIASFDHRRQRAEVIWLAAILPFRRRTIALPDIGKVVACKRERFDGTLSYAIRLSLRTGRNVSLRCRSRQEAVDAIAGLNDFLSLK